jgi:hypothetical protein
MASRSVGWLRTLGQSTECAVSIESPEFACFFSRADYRAVRGQYRKPRAFRSSFVLPVFLPFGDEAPSTRRFMELGWPLVAREVLYKRLSRLFSSQSGKFFKALVDRRPFEDGFGSDGFDGLCVGVGIDRENRFCCGSSPGGNEWVLWRQ